MMPDFFLGEIILESLKNPDCLRVIEPFRIKTRRCEMPGEKIAVWNIHRYRLHKDEVLKIIPLIEQGFAKGEWYMHFFSEQQNEMFVIMKGRTFCLPKHRDASWDEMIDYGESVGVGRRWTQAIPLNLPD